MDALIEKNKKKIEKQQKKEGLSYGNQMKKAASASTRTALSEMSDKEKEEKIEKAKESFRLCSGRCRVSAWRGRVRRNR